MNQGPLLPDALKTLLGSTANTSVSDDIYYAPALHKGTKVKYLIPNLCT